MAAIFRTTGSQVIDTILLVAMAALVGKLLTLVVAVMMGVISLALERTPYYSVIRAVTAHRAPDTNWNLIELAVVMIAMRHPGLSLALGRRRSEAIFAFGAGVELVVLVWLLRSQAWWIVAGVIVAAVVMLLLAVLKQVEYVAAISQVLIAADLPVTPAAPLEPKS